jgi:hypothetical protein
LQGLFRREHSASIILSVGWSVGRLVGWSVPTLLRPRRNRAWFVIQLVTVELTTKGLEIKLFTTGILLLKGSLLLGFNIQYQQQNDLESKIFIAENLL